MELLKVRFRENPQRVLAAANPLSGTLKRTVNVSAFSVPTEQETTETSSDKVKKIIFGRFMLPDMSEHPCQVSSIDADGATLLSEHVVEPGTAIIAYLEDVGRVDGTLETATKGGFYVAFNLTGQRRERMERRLEWVDKSDPSDRREERYVPKESVSQISLPDGRVYQCEVLDISVSGASIKTDVLPSIGTHLSLGKMRGRVVRYTSDGVGIEFMRQLESEKLDEQAVL